MYGHLNCAKAWTLHCVKTEFHWNLINISLHDMSCVRNVSRRISSPFTFSSFYDLHFEVLKRMKWIFHLIPSIINNKLTVSRSTPCNIWWHIGERDETKRRNVIFLPFGSALATRLQCYFVSSFYGSYHSRAIFIILHPISLCG